MTNAVNTSEMMTLLDRIERLEGERKEISADITEVWKEAKAKGYTKELKKAYGIRKMKVEDRRILGFYCDAMDLFA